MRKTCSQIFLLSLLSLHLTAGSERSLRAEASQRRALEETETTDSYADWHNAYGVSSATTLGTGILGAILYAIGANSENKGITHAGSIVGIGGSGVLGGLARTITGAGYINQWQNDGYASDGHKSVENSSASKAPYGLHATMYGLSVATGGIGLTVAGVMVCTGGIYGMVIGGLLVGGVATGIHAVWSLVDTIAWATTK